MSSFLLHSTSFMQQRFIFASTAAVSSLSKYRQACVSLPSLPPLPTSGTYASVWSGGPQCTTLCAALQSVHIPKAFVHISTLRQLSLSPYVFQFAFSHQMYNTCVHVRKVEVWYVWSTSWMCEFMSKLLANEFVDVCTTTDVWQKKISTLG